MRSTTAPSTPSELIRSALLSKISKNPAYSLRALARDLGVSHSFLSQVVAGKKGLSLSRFFQVSSLLQLDKATVDSIVRSGVLSKRSEKSISPLFVTLERDRFQILSHWWHIAILELSLTRAFRCDARWISKRLNITSLEAKKAIERLRRFRLLIRKDGRWVKSSEWLGIYSGAPNHLIRDYHRQMIGKAAEAIETQDLSERDITGSSFPLDPRRIPGAKKKIEKFRKELARYLSDGQCTQVGQLNVQLFWLSREQKRDSK